jgi:amidase
MLADPAQSVNPIFGRTNNPWDIERTPGGSSGGAAAALAAGMTPFEIGTDLTGSIRIPAHFSGVFGLKPTEHRVPLTGLIPGLPGPRPIRIMSCIGPMARTVEDLALLFSIIAGPDGCDADAAPAPVGEMPQLEMDRLRIAFAPTFPGFPVAAEVREAVQELAKRLSAQGAVVEEAALPQVDFQQEVASTAELMGLMMGAFQPEEQERSPTLAQYLEALAIRDQSIAVWERFLDKWDVLLCPPSMMTAFPHCEPGSPLRVDGIEVSYWMVSFHSTVFNYTGHPGVVLPYGLDHGGLPIGVQIVGKRWDESRLLAIAKAVSEVTDGFQRPPGY